MSERYKMFRNFMANELSITRDDIETWTKEAVAVEVKKLFGQMDVPGIIQANAKLSYTEQQTVVKMVAEILAKNLSVSLKGKE